MSEQFHYDHTIEVSPGQRRLHRYEIYNDSGPFKHLATCEKEEHAAFIVQAVNAHDALVEALQEITPLFNTARLLMDKESRDFAGEVVERAYALLKSSTHESPKS